MQRERSDMKEERKQIVDERKAIDRELTQMGAQKEDLQAKLREMQDKLNEANKVSYFNRLSNVKSIAYHQRGFQVHYLILQTFYQGKINHITMKNVL